MVELMEVSVRLVGSAAFKAVGTSDPRPAGSIPVHLRQFVRAFIFCVIGFIVMSPAASALADPGEPGNTLSVVQAVKPATGVITVDIVGSDAFVRMTVALGHEVEVTGYDEEPYLRIDKEGRVYENSWSPTLLISKTRYGNGKRMSYTYSQDQAPTWREVATTGTVMWHDHRVHWMSPIKPAAINDEGLVQGWSIDMIVDGTATVVSGSLYVRDVPGTWWWLFTVPAAALVLALGVRARRGVIAVVSATLGVVGVLEYIGVPTPARATPTLVAFAFFVGACMLGGVLLKKSEYEAVLTTTAGVALLVAAGLHRNQVTSRFVPGLGDSVWVRMVLPIALGVGVAAAWGGLYTLLRVPVVQEKNETV